MDDADIDRAGLAGRAGLNVDGDAGNPAIGFESGGGLVFTGVALGVVCWDETFVLMFEVVGWCRLGIGPW